ncbi:phytanoyl-CoA dioxygenase family protein [Streptomyces sp. CL12]|uniref:phytanoyl-CoA dioxygenase family protein n=1 Tax=Streptomyces sp. CL12 TaxID=3391744 RepID=UPI003A80751D
MVDVVRGAAESYRTNGFYVAPALIPADVLDEACAGVDEVLAGRYETGLDPHARNWVPSERDGDVISIAEPHRCNRAIRACVDRPELGEWAAGLTGVNHVEIIAVDLFHKGPRTRGRAHVGWHQDSPFLEGEDEVLTAWLALSDVTADSAPLMYVRGSHLAGVRTDRSHFFAPDLDPRRVAGLLPSDVRRPEIVTVTMPRGAFVFHHRLTLHASGANTTSGPRSSLALRLRVSKTGRGGPAIPGHEVIPLYTNAPAAGL